MRRLYIIMVCLLGCLCAQADSADGWTMYLAYHNNTFNQPAGNLVYSLCDGNLLSFSPDDDEVRLLSKVDGLSGKNILRMGYSQEKRCLVLVYDDANIDLLFADGTICNLPQLKNGLTDEFALSNLCVSGSWAALTLPTGVALVDLEQRNLKGVYDLGQKVYASAVFDGLVFAAIEAQILACPLSSNLSDKTLWQRQQYAAVRNFLPFAGRLYFTVQRFVNPFAVGLWYVTAADADGRRDWKQVNASYYTTLFAGAACAVLTSADELCLISAADADQPQTYAVSADWTHLSRTADGTFWASCAAGGLQPYRLAGGALTAAGEAVGNYGPKRDLFYYMRYVGNRLIVAGGRLDPYDRVHYPGTLMTLEDGRWTAFEEDGIAAQTGVAYRDMTSIAQDPGDPTHHFATSNTGLYEFRDGKFVNYYSFENSPLRSIIDGSKYFIRLDGLSYDAQGNLWMVNNQVDTTLRVLLADGTWKGVYVEALRQAPTLEKTLFDRDGRLWVASRRTVSNHTAGLLCLDPRGTVGTDEVRVRYRTSSLNEDGASFTFGGVYALMEDEDGSIWVGTNHGLIVVDDPAAWFDTDFTVTQIKVPRNDGTNYADYLLAGVPVSALAADGAGRKWIGTYGSGLYLVSPDGTEILDHFTADATPLLSDNIYSLAINPQTGEVMIGTDVGLCSYQSHATPAAAALSKSQVSVYPNPVRPGYSGVVAIAGLTRDADVKIVSTGGQVVAAGTSLGGTFTWDVHNASGQRVATGVYYIMVTTADAKSGIVAKVLVI